MTPFSTLQVEAGVPTSSKSLMSLPPQSGLYPTSFSSATAGAAVTSSAEERKNTRVMAGLLVGTRRASTAAKSKSGEQCVDRLPVRDRRGPAVARGDGSVRVEAHRGEERRGQVLHGDRVLVRVGGLRVGDAVHDAGARP